MCMDDVILLKCLLCRLPASEGFRAWPFLQSLHLDHNLLSGSLPASWGGDGSMASLRNLTLTYNMLVGSIPPTWASGTAGKRRFPALQSLILQPGARPSPWFLPSQIKLCVAVTAVFLVGLPLRSFFVKSNPPAKSPAALVKLITSREVATTANTRCGHSDIAQR